MENRVPRPCGGRLLLVFILCLWAVAGAAALANAQTSSPKLPSGGDPALSCGQTPNGRAYWTEYGFCEIPVKGPLTAKGLIIWSHGVSGDREQYRNAPPPVIRRFASAGRLSAEMIATLNGPGFKIEAITPEQQTIAKGFPTVWSWNIEAKQDGDQELEATLYGLVPSGWDKAARQRVDSYTQKSA